MARRACDGTNIRTSSSSGYRFSEALDQTRMTPRADRHHDLRSLRPITLPRRQHAKSGVNQVGGDGLVFDVGRDEVTEDPAVTKVGEPGDRAPGLWTLIRCDLACDLDAELLHSRRPLLARV